MTSTHKKISILYLGNNIGETNTMYNEFFLPFADRYDITVCLYFEPEIEVAEAVDLRHGHGTIRGFIGAIRQLLAEREFDVIHAHSAHSGFMFLLAVPGHRSILRSTVISVQNSYQNYKLRNKLLFLPSFLFFQHVVCCSKSSRASFPLPYRWLAGRRLGYVQNGADTDRVDRVLADRQPGEQSDGLKIISVGRLIDIKNPVTLVEAIRLCGHRSSRLDFIGQGYLDAAIRQAVAERSLSERVSLSGLLPRDDVYVAMSQADIFVSTSYGEGLPLAVLEAMACSCPVILSDIDPHREIAEVCDCIPLVPADDSAGFAREIDKMAALSPEQRAAIGAQCRATVETYFSNAVMQRGFHNIYSEIVGN